MPYMVQSKGMQHCRDIHEAAAVIHKAYNYNKPWKQCLLEALRNHRLLILDLLEVEGLSMPSIRRTRQAKQEQQQQPNTISREQIEQQMHMGNLDLDSNWHGDWHGWREECQYD